MTPVVLALKFAFVGALLGIFFVGKGLYERSQMGLPIDPTLGAARVLGGIIGGAVLLGLIGITIGLFRRNKGHGR